MEKSAENRTSKPARDVCFLSQNIYKLTFLLPWLRPRGICLQNWRSGMAWLLFLVELQGEMWKLTVFSPNWFSLSSISWHQRAWNDHTTIIDHVCMLSDVIACAQQLLIALHGGDLRLTHFSHPAQSLISPISHKYAEEFRSQNYIMMSIVDMLHVHSICIWLSSCLVENEQLKGWSFIADFRPKSMFSQANSPAIHCNRAHTSVKHASHHYTCSV